MGGGWRVHSWSSESPVHKADNVLVEELYRIWQTHAPSDEAWLILQADPPIPFEKLEIVNAGSSLIELYGLPEKETAQEGGEGDEELLLSTQQVMTLKDLTNKSNRNRTFTYAIPQKLSPLAAQNRWKQLRIVCRQPFGTSEHRACIGLSRINVISCNTEARSSESSVKTSMPEEGKKACSTDKSTKGIGSDANYNTKTLLMNDKDSKGDIKKRKLPAWDVKTCKSADYSPKNTVGDKGPSEEKQQKQISEGSEGNGKVATSEHTGKAVNIESKGGILSSDDSKMNSLSSPKSMVQQKKRKTASNGKDPASNVAVASPSNTFNLSSSSAEGGGTSKSKPNIGSFGTLLDGVVFAISGLVNPERGNLRSQALEMGAEYEPDWNPRCTLLICAFPNTPKYKQVKDDGGTIVSKEWITECYKQKKLVDIDHYLMHAGKPWRKLQTSNISPVSGKQSKQRGNELEQTQRELEQTERELEQPKKKMHLGGRTVSVRNNNTKIMDAKSSKKVDFNTSEVRKWVVEDINASVSWLQEQPEKPKPSELKEIAIQGIEACLEDTSKCLEENKSVHTVLDNWEFIPRVVKEIAALEDSRKGSQTISRDELCKRAHAFRKLYEIEFENLRKVIQQNKRKDQTGSDNQSSGALDRSKEVDASKSDADSDDTIVMDEDELDETEAEVSKNYSRN